jgi:hypothetical protein
MILPSWLSLGLNPKIANELLMQISLFYVAKAPPLFIYDGGVQTTSQRSLGSSAESAFAADICSLF